MTETQLGGQDSGRTPEVEVNSATSQAIRFLSIILRNRRLVIDTCALVVVLIVGATLAKQRTYTATATFEPQTGATPSAALAGVAAQFGIALPMGDAGQSPDFYAALLRSRPILEAVAEARYEFVGRLGLPLMSDTGTVTGSLVYLLVPQGNHYSQQRERAMSRLGGATTVQADAQTGMVTLSVQSPWPDLSRQVTQRFLQAVDSFNIKVRQSQGTSERRFVENRLHNAQAEMGDVEHQMETFLERNRDWSTSPVLAGTHDRLQREVSLHQQMVVSLAQAYEQARIDEVRDTPVITVVEKPELPALPDPRHTAVIGLLALLLGLIMGAVAAVVKDGVARSRTSHQNEFAEFDRLWQGAFGGLGTRAGGRSLRRRNE